jgi:cell division protein FtsL
MPVLEEATTSRNAPKLRRREVNEVSDTIQEIENDLMDRASFHARAAHHAPGSEHYSHFRGDLEAAPKVRTRFVGAHRHVPARQTQDTSTATLSTLDEDALIFHEVRAAVKEATPVPMEEVVAEAARRRRRARAPHRAFRLTGTQMMIGGLLLAQLLMVLWLQSQSLALRNKDYKLRREIAQTHELIAQKKNQISKLDSETHLNQLAGQMRWGKAPLTNFDKINDTRRLTAPEMASLNDAPLNGDRLARAD